MFLYQNQKAALSEYEFAIETEYGFAKDWAAGIKLPLRNTFVQSSTAGYSDNFLSSFGMGDAAVSLTWLVVPGDSRLAIESLSTIPFYSADTFSTGEAALGDGTFSTGIKLHGGHIMNGRYSFGLSPGYFFRFKKYSSRFTLDTTFGVAIKPVYFRLVSELILSTDAGNVPTTVTSNPSAGSGGSFAKLSAAPNLWNLGLVAGVFFYEQYRLELFFSQAILGSRAGYGYHAGLAFATTFDFYKEEKKIQVKQVPFDAEPTPDK